MSATAYIALGSNLGDRAQLLQQAIALLRAQPGVTVTRCSSFHETKPVGGPPGQGDYLNAALALETDLAPQQLLQVLHAIEQQLGRVRRERDGPRTLDLDLLLYGALILHELDLEIPHPRLHQRRFVLEPLHEIAPSAVHPVLGKTIAVLWYELLLPARPLLGLRALVTGATSGIGLAIATAFTAAGAQVILHGRTQDKAQAAVAMLGGQTASVLAELTDAAQCERLVETVWRDWGTFDIWVNNAGADVLTGPAAAWDFDTKLHALWTVDVLATLRLGRAVGERMRAAGGGVILNMGWDQADTGMESDSGQLFATTKGAIHAFTRSLALSLAPHVRVNCLAPGWIRTAWGQHASAIWQERVQRETPLQRWGTPEDVAQTACWLASPAAAFITGQIVRVNGGAVRG